MVCQVSYYKLFMTTKREENWGERGRRGWEESGVEKGQKGTEEREGTREGIEDRGGGKERGQNGRDSKQ